MAGAKIMFLLTILLAPEAVPAYKLKYFNVLTNATMTISYPMNTNLASALRFVFYVSKASIHKQTNKNKISHNIYLTNHIIVFL